MPQKEQLDYAIVEQFLKGEFDLAEITALRSIPHATRALVAQTIVLASPETFLLEPYDKFILSYPLNDFYREVFGWQRFASIMEASRIKGLHRSGTGKARLQVHLVISSELRALVKQYSDSKTLADAVRYVRQEMWGRTSDVEMRNQDNEARAKRIVDTLNFLEETFDKNDLVYLTWLLRRRLGDLYDFSTDPDRKPHYSHHLDNLVARLEKETRKR